MEDELMGETAAAVDAEAELDPFAEPEDETPPEQADEPAPATAEEVEGEEPGDASPQQKHRRLKKQADHHDEDDDGAEDKPPEEGLKIPKKKTSRKKGAGKKGDDQDEEFVPSSGAFDKNHLDADDVFDEDFEERKSPKKKPPSAGKIYFDEVLKRVKERKKKTVQLTPEECQHYCRQLVERMIAAAAMDVEAVKQGKPGLAKLKMLNDISEFSKPAWRTWCITEGAAVALASWISALPDGSLPNLSVRTKVLQIALQLPFQSNDLRDNDLGRVIVALWKHPDECESNRVLIRSIVQKWVRPMLGLASNYADMQQDYGVPEKSSMLSVDGEEKERKISHKFPQHKTQMGSIIVNQERINSKLTQMFRVIEARRKAPSRATKVNMDGTLI